MAVATRSSNRIESLLSARLFLNPQLAGERLYFVSNLAGRMSLYGMDVGGSIPDPLLPAAIALQNPELLMGQPFYVLPELDRIVVMVDSGRDENYQPLVIPLEGGFPEPLNDEALGGRRSHLVDVDLETAIGYFVAESREEATLYAVRVDLTTGAAETLGQSTYGAVPVAWTPDHDRVVLADEYTAGDSVLYEHDPDTGARSPIFGTPIDEREEGAEYPLSGFRSAHFTEGGRGLLLATSLFDDAYGPGYLDLERRGHVEPVELEGVTHEGHGELEELRRLGGDAYVAVFNIDGVSWAYEAVFDEGRGRLSLGRVLCGRGELAAGVLHGLFHDRSSGRFCLSFCTATEPTQLYVLGPEETTTPARQTRERPRSTSTATGAARTGWITFTRSPRC